MKTIQVKTQSTWFAEQPITVQILDDAGDVLECDHAGAEDDTADFGGLVHDSVGDLDWQDDEQWILKCDKCDWYTDREGNEYYA